MTKRALGRTGLSIDPLILGSNVFGWTIDATQSFAVLDAFAAEGFAMIDTADSYSIWVEGNTGGESETIIGSWIAARGNRDRIILATKVGTVFDNSRKDLSADYIARAAEDSLRRLKTDHIDLYQAHWPDPGVTHEETLRAFENLLTSGKVGAIGCSNYDAGLLGAALQTSQETGLPRYETVQPEYNLYTRGKFEGLLQQLCLESGIGVIPYYGLASGFLTGKYRSPADFSKSARGGRMETYLNPKGRAILQAMDSVAAETGASLAEIAIAWIIAQPGITAPIASATSPAHVESLARGARLALNADQIVRLNAAGAG